MSDLASVRNIPGFAAMPVVGWRGNYFQFMQDPIRYVQALYERFGPLCGMTEFREGQPGTLCVFAPDYYQQILGRPVEFYSRHITQSSSEDTALARLGAGVISLNGEVHKQHRRMMMPAFHRKRIEAYRDDMVGIVERVIGDWKPGETRNMLREMERVTIGVAVKTLFGDDESVRADQISAAFERILRLNVWSGLLPLNLPLLPYNRLLAEAGALESTIREIIARRRASGRFGPDVLSMLMESRDDEREPLTDEELVGEINILFIAGHDTTSRALTWTLFLLSQHPEVLAALLDELSGQLGGRAPDVEQLDHLPLLERVIKESMRLLPPGTYTTRRAMEPFELGSYHLPRNTVLFISMYLTHRLPELYPQPQKFWPDRWLSISPSPYEYMPFGAGPRMCIGAPFAMMEIKIALAVILQRFRLDVVPGTHVDRDEKTSLRPKGGLPMTLHAQDHALGKSVIYGNIHEMVDLGSDAGRRGNGQ